MCLLAAPALAEEPSGSKPKFSVSDELIALAIQSPQAPSSAERNQWNDEMLRLNQRIRRDKWLMVAGGGAFFLGYAVRVHEKESGLQYVTDYGFGTATMLYVIGTGLAGYGAFDWFRSTERRNELTAEGRRKGFMASVSPTAVSFAFRTSF